MMAESTVIEAIRVEGRHRTDFGDIAALARSMDDVGLLQPVVITPDLRLVAGERRIRAARSLGWTTIAARVVSNLTEAADLLRAERDENTCRKSMTPTEAESVAAAIEAELRPLAKARQGHGETGPGRNASAKFAEALPRPRETAAASTGYSAETIRKVRKAKQLAAAPDTPEPVREAAAQALAEMDDTGKVDAAYKKVQALVTASDYVAKYPDLGGLGDPKSVARLGSQLDTMGPSERERRLENLRKSIAADQRRAAEPPTEPTVDHYAKADAIFLAANRLARTITNEGGADSIAQALDQAEPITVANWRAQFTEIQAAMGPLIDATSPTLRRVK